VGQCTAIKRNGEPCTLPANGSHGLCWAHDPKNAEKRRKGASRGGKAKANRELPAIKASIRATIDGVLAGEVERGVAAVAFQGFNSLLKAVEVERRLREQDELLERLGALEEAHSRRGRSWG